MASNGGCKVVGNFIGVRGVHTTEWAEDKPSMTVAVVATVAIGAETEMELACTGVAMTGGTTDGGGVARYDQEGSAELAAAP